MTWMDINILTDKIHLQNTWIIKLNYSLGCPCYNRLYIELHVHILDARNMGRMFKILLQYNS